MGLQDQVARAREAKERLTPEQRSRRARVERHTETIAAGVKRGPNAPKDGTFGGKPREAKAAA